MNRKVYSEGARGRQLEQVEQLEEEGHGPSRISALIMASFGGACIVLSALVLMYDPKRPETAVHDPLGDLVAQSEAAAPGVVTQHGLVDTEVTFPSVLSDQAHPTTSMELVRAQDRRGDEPAPEAVPTGPPPATDRLPVVPLPAQHILHGSEASVASSDRLHQVAKVVGREESDDDLAPAGGPGGYQLQVSSFKTAEEASVFALALRRRGHRAYVQEAHVQGRGLWHRVRVGPFKFKRSADLYRERFEAQERLVSFVVNPPKTTVRIEP